MNEIELELQLVEVEPEETNEEKIKGLLHKLDLIAELIKSKKQRKVSNDR